MVTEDRREPAAAVEVKEDHEEDQVDHQEAAEQDRSHMGLLDPPRPLEASVEITRLWAPLGSGARATSGRTACSPATRGRRSTGRRVWTTTPG